MPEVVDDPLPCLVVDDEFSDVIALGRRVLGVEPGVEVEARAVQGAGETVLVLKAEDPALHLGCRGDFRYGLMLVSEPHALQPAVPPVRKR